MRLFKTLRSLVFALWFVYLSTDKQKDWFRTKYNRIPYAEWKRQTAYLEAHPEAEHTIDPNTQRVSFKDDEWKMHYLLKTGGRK